MPPLGHSKYSIETRKKIKRLHQKGFSNAKIAEIVKCSTFTVYYSLRMLKEINGNRGKARPFAKKTNKTSVVLPLKNTRDPKVKTRNDSIRSALVHSYWNCHINIELGETIYSGPPSKYKEGATKDATLAQGTEKFVDSNSDEPADNTSHCTRSSVIGKDPYHSNNETCQHVDSNKKLLNHLDLVDSGTSSPQSDGPVQEEEEPHTIATEKLSHCDSGCPVSIVSGQSCTNDSANEQNLQANSNTLKVSLDYSDSDSSGEMVRLVQETVKCDPYTSRKGVRVPKRISSVDSTEIQPNSKAKKSARSRKHSCRSDSEVSETFSEDYSDLNVLDKSVSVRKLKNGECHNSDASLTAKVNGAVNGLNGVSKQKAKRGSRTNSDEIDTSSLSKGLNGDENNDRVDINLLLEISVSDRKLFENKKAKIKRKTADWTLISETEQYYNEKEEILRKKSQPDSESDSESDESCETPVKPARSETEKAPAVHTPSKKAKKNTLTIKQKKRKCRTKSDCVEEDTTRPRSVRSSNCRQRKSRYDLSTLDDQPNDTQDSMPRSKARNNTVQRRLSKDNVCKPKKRLTDAERFLRDNREYYQFPQTSDRLRRNPTTGKDVVGGEQSDDTPCDPTPNKGKPPEISLPDSVPPPPDPKLTELPQAKVPEGELAQNIYYSFEGVPCRESWYETYQRLIDGAESNEYVYHEDSLRFVLPYQMPKDYLKGVHAKQLASKRKDLNDLVRKSPRCHASTLALFSDILPTKKTKAKSKLKKQEEISSDGAESVRSQSLRDTKESQQDLATIAQYMDQMISTTIEEKAPPVVEKRRGRKRKQPKGRSKAHKDPPTMLDSPSAEYFLPECCKEFDNQLANDIDPDFLTKLPTYLKEINAFPDDLFSKLSHVIVDDAMSCTCTQDRLPFFDTLSADDMTEASSESMSICSTDTMDSRSKGRRVGSYKKRRKNMTGWPKQKKRKPVPVPRSDDNESVASAASVPRRPSRSKLLVKKTGRKRMIERILCNSLDRCEKRGSTRRKASVLYSDSWSSRRTTK